MPEQKNFFSKISDWANERNILRIEFNKCAQASFIAEELAELAMSKSDNERIDAYCDLIVYCSNAICAHEQDDIDVYFHVSRNYQEVVDAFPDDPFDSIILKALSILLRQDDSVFESLLFIIIMSMLAIRTLEYDVDLAMEETLKEINSRVGAFNPVSGKWEKDKSPQAQANWYKADYDVARLQKF